MIRLINNDFRKAFATLDRVRMVFADPPDNIRLGYGAYKDALSTQQYEELLRSIVYCGIELADIVWVSYNAQHTFRMGRIIDDFLREHLEWEAKACVQTYTFGQHRQTDLGNNHRPLVRLMKKGTALYPDAIRVPSWRQLHGDKRADPRGRVPGDVFDIPRVTGNSKQRRKYHPTQLNELLYGRCIRLTCKPQDTVCDFFAGTGTLARVCMQTKNPCVMVEIDRSYCEHIAKEHRLKPVSDTEWSD